MKKIVIVAHKFLPQIDDDLFEYLARKKNYRVIHITHSFPDSDNRRSYYEEYFSGKRTKFMETRDYKFLPEPLVYLKEFFFTLKWLLFSQNDVYLAMDGMCAFFGLILRWINVCKKVVYWSIDFVPVKRFNSNWKNYIYHKINLFACKNADEVWDLSPRMANGRRKYFGITSKDYKSRKVIQNGVWLRKIKRIPFSQCRKNTLIFVGHLLKKQGIDIILRAIPKIVQKKSDFRFEIIGDGSYKTELEKLINDLKIQKYCRFGGVLTGRKLEKRIAESCAAIAPYINSPDSYTYYADPNKIKVYLGCGVPILTTRLPWNAEEIERNKCGIIIKDDGSDLIKKLNYIMRPKVNQEYRNNAVKYLRKFDYGEIFKSLPF